MRWILFILFTCRLFGADFDYAVIGTNPISLFEALYKHYSGKTVLVLEAAAECGGAWKSIQVCGVAHADMGCHDISSNPNLNSFLEEYAGCRMISCDNNYYFSQGCFELVDNLLKRIVAAKIPLLTNCRVDSVCIDSQKKECQLKTKKGVFTAAKVVVTPGNSFSINDAPVHKIAHKFYHLYLLIQDPTPPRFSYRHGIANASRMMNLTSFVDLDSTGRQLIVLQVHSDQLFDKGAQFIEDLKKQNLIGSSAYLLKAEPYIYEQGHFNISELQTNQQPFFEMLNTSHFNVIGTYAPKWKEVIPPL